MLVFDNVVYDYPDGTHALDGLSFAIAAGERVALLGPNGAGKSTLMLHTNGILCPRSGTVHVDGMLVDKAHLVKVREVVGLVFQDPEDQLFMPSVHEDIGFGPLNMGLDPEEVHHRIHAALDAVDLEDIRLKAGAHISFGQKKRIALATVLACENTLLVLDEPTSNLDPRSRRQMIELLDRLDATMLVATHDIDFAWDLCPRSLIINKGRVVADGPTRELLCDEELLYENGLEPPGAVRYGMTRS
ncbi:MAG: ATP-binding cassette domain-containing protein [Actinobacteria bacterium]|nr:ATP-binding cassette domain-containing protein [Actinomycetota bacterium]